MDLFGLRLGNSWNFVLNKSFWFPVCPSFILVFSVKCLKIAKKSSSWSNEVKKNKNLNCSDICNFCSGWGKPLGKVWQMTDEPIPLVPCNTISSLGFFPHSCWWNDYHLKKCRTNFLHFCVSPPRHSWSCDTYSSSTYRVTHGTHFATRQSQKTQQVPWGSR